MVPRSGSSLLLVSDAAVNLVLGGILLFFPRPLIRWLGLPCPSSAFYPSILGAVLLGIGLALLLERARGGSGLGLGGAVTINACGGVALAGWLLLGDLALPFRGRVFLWGLVLPLLLLSSVELGAGSPWTHRGQDEPPSDSGSH